MGLSCRINKIIAKWSREIEGLISVQVSEGKKCACHMKLTLTRWCEVIMKKFSIEKVIKSSANTGQCRLGRLTLKPENVDNKDDLQNSLEEGNVFGTPMYFLHTQTGSIPHITPEVLSMIYPTSNVAGAINSMPPLQISLNSTFKFAESLRKFQKGIAKFVGLSEHPVVLTIHDPLTALRPGYNDKFGIALWSRHGRRSFTPQQCSDVMDSYKACFSQIISDYDIQPESCGMKRLRKSLARAEEYTSHVLQQKTGKYDSVGLFMTIEAAWFKVDERLAKKTIANLLESQDQLEGVILEGLTSRFALPKIPTSDANENGKRPKVDTERVNICEKVDLDLLEKILQVLPSTLPKYIPGPFPLTEMLEMISKGVDIFDTSVASRMTDDAKVFILDGLERTLPSVCFSEVPLSNPSESLAERTNIAEGSSCNDIVAEENAVVFLKDKRFFDDFSPISRYCTCYTCRKHTRSYIYHLFATDEILGPVLIQIHNLTVLDRFFKIVRAIIKDADSAESLQKKLEIVKQHLAVPTGTTKEEDLSQGEGVQAERNQHKWEIKN